MYMQHFLTTNHSKFHALFFPLPSVFPDFLQARTPKQLAKMCITLFYF